MADATKRIRFLTDVEEVDAKLLAIAISQSMVSINLSTAIGFELEKVEFTVEYNGQVIRWKLVDP